MLMKPKRWLAYNIELNDLLPSYQRIVERFAVSDIPLDASFGSNTEEGCRVPGIVIAIGPAVEPARLAEVLALLEGPEDQFLVLHQDAPHGKVIYIGALNLDNEPIVQVSERILAVIHRDGAGAQDLRAAIASAPKVHPMVSKEDRG